VCSLFYTSNETSVDVSASVGASVDKVGPIGPGPTSSPAARSQEAKKCKKLSYCCDSRSYCMQQYHWLKQLLRDIYFNAINLIVIAASRPVNKNVNTGAVTGPVKILCISTVRSAKN